jgi:hypothetical protein
MAAPDPSDLINFAPPAPPAPVNPYNVSKIMGPPPTNIGGPPPVVDAPGVMPSFIESTGAAQGLGMGHFATQADVQAHHDALAAAKDYAATSEHFTNLHNNAQKELDTGDAFQDMAKFDATHPDAALHIAQSRAKYPHADDRAYAYPEKVLSAHQANLDRLEDAKAKAALKPPTDVKDVAAVATMLKKAHPNLQIDDMTGPEWNMKDAAGQITTDPSKAASYFMEIPGAKAAGRSDKDAFMTLPKSEYQRLRGMTQQVMGTGAAVGAAPTVKAPSPEFLATQAGTQTNAPVDHAGAIKWAVAHPTDPRTAVILARNKINVPTNENIRPSETPAWNATPQ